MKDKKYYILKEGDVIKKGDEFLLNTGEWILPMQGILVGYPWRKDRKPCRRPIKKLKLG